MMLHITSEETQDDFKGGFLSLTWIASVGFVMSVILNTILICAIKESNTFHEIEAFLYQMLAFWDMFVSCMTLMTTSSFFIFRQLEGNDIMEVVIGLLFVFAYYQTLFIVLTIHVCRCIMIVRPLRYLTVVTRRNIRISQIAWFIMSIVLICSLVLTIKEASNPILITLVFPMILGFAIQLMTSSQILFTSVKQSRRIHAAQGNMARGRPGEENIPVGGLNQGNSFKGIRTIIVITVSYWIAWCPWVILFLDRTLSQELPPWFRQFTGVTTMLNTIWNPAIHYATNQTCRIAVENILRRIKTRYLSGVCSPQ